MTVETETNVVSYIGNGATVTFPFNFPVYDELHLVVYKQVKLTGELDKIYSASEYSVAGVGDPNGGSVTLEEILSADYKVIITRQVPLTQDLDVSNQGGFYPETIEEEFDIQEMQIQQLKEGLDRTVRVNYGDTMAALPSWSERANMFLAFDPVGNPIMSTGGKGDPGANAMSIGLFADADALNIPVGTDVVHTSGWGSAGVGEALYVADPAVDAAYVLAYPRTSFMSANGRGFRLSTGQRINVLMAGAVGDGVTPDGPAFVGMLAWLKSIAVNPDFFYQGSPRLFIPAANYWLDDVTLDITHTLIIEGDSSMNGYSSRLVWSDVTGIRIQAQNTSGADQVIADGFNSGSYTILRNLGLAGPAFNTGGDFTGFAESESHGIHCRSNYIIEDCMIDGFLGDGIHVQTSVGGGGADEGNSNCSFISRVRVTNVRDGLHIDGADANAGVYLGIIGTYCRRYTVWDDSFLGNLHMGHHSSGAGLVEAGPSSNVSYMGNWYTPRYNQAGAASVNPPSGTTEDNDYWLYISAGGVSVGHNFLAWVNGMTLRASGCYLASNISARNGFINMYSEAGDGPWQGVAPNYVVGGLFGSRGPVFDPDRPGNWYAGESFNLMAGGTVGLLRAQQAAGSTRIASVHNTVDLNLGVSTMFMFEQGYEADGITPAQIGGVGARPSTIDSATTTSMVSVFVRTVGGGGALTEMFTFDGVNEAFRINNKIVVGPRLAALPADATDLPTALTLLNAIKARMKVTGGHGLVED